MRGTRSTIVSELAAGLLAGSAVGATAQEGATAPERFIGIIDCGGQVACGTTESRLDPVGESTMQVVAERGHNWSPRAREISDPRLEGRYTISFDNDSYYPPGDAESVDVGAGTWRIVNDDGAWQGSYHIVDGAPVIVPLVGEDDYEGLAAFVASELTDACTWGWSGVIIDDEATAYPEPPVE